MREGLWLRGKASALHAIAGGDVVYYRTAEDMFVVWILNTISDGGTYPGNFPILLYPELDLYK